MEIVIIYFGTMLVTSAIEITAKYKGSIFVPTYYFVLGFLKRIGKMEVTKIPV